MKISVIEIDNDEKKKKKIDEEDLSVHRKSILKAGKREVERYRGQTRAIH